MSSRERFFECVVPRNGEESRIAVRAWTADEALANVGQILRAAGMDVSGLLVARPMRRPPPSILGTRPRQARAAELR